MKLIRKWGFRLKDRVSGNPVQNNISEIKEVLKNPFGENALQIREEYLQSLLTHASQTVPYYKPCKGSSLGTFPIIKKTEIQNSFEAFKSDPLKNEPLFKVSTSGSTGVPFILYHNSLKRRRNTSDVLYFMGETGYEVGNALIELEVWRGHNQRSRIMNLLQNTFQFDVTKLSDQKIEEFLKLVEGRRGSGKHARICLCL